MVGTNNGLFSTDVQHIETLFDRAGGCRSPDSFPAADGADTLPGRMSNDLKAITRQITLGSYRTNWIYFIHRTFSLFVWLLFSCYETTVKSWLPFMFHWCNSKLFHSNKRHILIDELVRH